MEGGPSPEGVLGGGDDDDDDNDVEEEQSLSWCRLLAVPAEEGGCMLAVTLLIDNEGEADGKEGACGSSGMRPANAGEELVLLEAEAGCMPKGSVFPDPVEEGECISGVGGMYSWS